jgi:hypothetical protein
MHSCADRLSRYCARKQWLFPHRNIISCEATLNVSLAVANEEVSMQRVDDMEEVLAIGDNREFQV